MIQIYSAWKRYNANSNDRNVGDCVKRSLSFAYGVDYDEISRQLNKIKRKIGSQAFNSYRTYTKFLQDSGAESININAYDTMTEEEFSKKWNQGVYVCLTGPENKNYATHMVCIMNGDIIDSWDSSDYVVRSAYEIPNVSLETSEVYFEDIELDLYDFIDEYLYKACRKYEDWFKCWRTCSYFIDETTAKMEFYLETKDLPDESKYYPNQIYVKRITIKLNPRMNAKQNLESLKPKLKQKVYDWIYLFQKDKRDVESLKKLETHPNYLGYYRNKLDLLKLPEWCRKYVLRFFIDESPTRYGYKYELDMEALPGDPQSSIVEFRAESMKGLKDQLQQYKDSYRRLRYNY